MEVEFQELELSAHSLFTFPLSEAAVQGMSLCYFPLGGPIPPFTIYFPLSLTTVPCMCLRYLPHGRRISGT